LVVFLFLPVQLSLSFPAKGDRSTANIICLFGSAVELIALQALSPLTGQASSFFVFSFSGLAGISFPCGLMPRKRRKGKHLLGAQEKRTRGRP